MINVAEKVVLKKILLQEDIENKKELIKQVDTLQVTFRGYISKGEYNVIFKTFKKADFEHDEIWGWFNPEKRVCICVSKRGEIFALDVYEPIDDIERLEWKVELSK